MPGTILTDQEKWRLGLPVPAAAEVQKIEIVGMPERWTTTEITRDQMGNIVSSTQTEGDVQP